MLLMGMALEAALKAVLVADRPDLITGETIPKNLAHHRLAELWSTAGLRRARGSGRYCPLERLESFLVTFGRYPISRTANGMKKLKGATFNGQIDFAHVERLFAQLAKHVEVKVPQLCDEPHENA